MTWLPVSGYEGLYEVSDTGHVRSLSDRYGRVRVLSPGVTESGHRQVTLTKDGHRRKHYVQRLVMAAFVGPRPQGQVVRHIFGDPSDNALTSLAYGTEVENQADSFRHGTHWSLHKTHCKRGHPLPEKRTGRRGNGQRVCPICAAERSRAYRARKRG